MPTSSRWSPTPGSSSRHSQACRSRRRARHVLPFPSQEVDPYRGLAPHLEVASARARALHALATGTRAARRRVGARAAAAARAIRRPARGGRHHARARIGDLAAGSRRAAGAGRLHRRRIRSTSTASSASAAASSISIPAAEPQPIRLEFVGDIIESIRRYDAATQRSLAALDRVVGQPAARAAAGPDRRRTIRPRSIDRPSIVDYVRQAGARARRVRDRRRRGARAGAGASSGGRAADDAQARGRAVPAVRHARGRPGTRLAALARRRPPQSAELADRRRPTTGGRTSPCVPADRSITAASATGSRRSAEAARPRRADRVRRRHARPGRADDRAAGRLRHPRARGRRRRRSARARPCSSRPASCRRASTCRPADLRLFAETDLFEEERRVARAPPLGRAARSSPISAI